MKKNDWINKFVTIMTDKYRLTNNSAESVAEEICDIYMNFQITPREAADIEIDLMFKEDLLEFELSKKTIKEYDSNENQYLNKKYRIYQM